MEDTKIHSVGAYIDKSGRAGLNEIHEIQIGFLFYFLSLR